MKAYHEHQFKNAVKRLYPPAMFTRDDALKVNHESPLLVIHKSGLDLMLQARFAEMPGVSRNNRLMHEWYRGMCILNQQYCTR